MRAVMVMFDSLNRHMLQPYGCTETLTPNFCKLAERTVQFDRCYAGSLPCMPARRELHTGRYNFLHRSWGPIEPFDRSMPEILGHNGVHTHLASDHTHYWEDGGATYHTRYSTWENFRGQEGDGWKGVVGGMPDEKPNLIVFDGYRRKLYDQDVINRSYLQNEKDHPQVKTFEAGLEFLETNAAADRWFLQIETFDPHEPFFTYERFRELFPDDQPELRFDWPDYAAVKETPEQVAKARREYAAMLAMCDHYLGKVLEAFDKLDLWKDTMLIVNTDHGFMLGEHGFWAKNYMPLYNEIANTPLFIWDPRNPVRGERREGLVQTIDLPVTLLNYFGVPVPEEMQGVDITPLLAQGETVREYGLFGIHGRHICITDGEYVYMKAPAAAENRPLYNYTLMPTHMPCFFTPAEIKTMEKQAPFNFTQGMPSMRFTANAETDVHSLGNLLFHVAEDPAQQSTVADGETVARMEAAMVRLMEENDAPAEQYQRMGLQRG